MTSIIILTFIIIYILTIFIVSYNLIIKTKREKDKNRDQYEHDVIDNMEFYRNFSDSEKYKYYDYIRDEIKREDQISHQRLTWGITFHAFLINAFSILLVFGWSDNPDYIKIFRRVSIISIGMIGLTFSFSTLIGIMASRRSLNDTKERWNAVNMAWEKFYPKYVPQAFGQTKSFSWGHWSVILIPIGLISLWSLLTVGYLIIYLKN